MKFLSVAKYLSLAILAINDETVAAKHLKGGRKNDNTNNHSSVEAAEEAEIISNITSGSKNDKRKDYSIPSSSTTTATTNTTPTTLPTDGFCWIHEDGKFCFQGSNFQSITKNHDELTIQTFMEGGTSYSYSIINAAKIRADIQSIGETTGNSQLDHALADETWIDSMEGMKFGCQVADLVDGNFFDSSDEELLSSNGDGSSIWKLSSWIVNVDANGIPINISIPTTTSTSAEWSSGGGEYEIIASISGIEEITAATLPFETCDPESTDANESLEVTEASHERFLRILDAHDKSVSDEEYFEQEGKRRLDWTTDLQGWISNTQWCGAGTDLKTTPCPDRNKDFDFWADQACRRHDHGRKHSTTWVGLPRLECFVDKDLNDLGGHNFAVAGAYGTFGGMGAIGCYNYESYNCFYWEGWFLKYGYCGKKWEVNYGPWRYSNAVKTAGYSARPQTCPYDSWVRW